MRNLLAKHVVVGISMRIDMDKSYRSVLFYQCAQNRQRQGVIATERKRHQRKGVQPGVVVFYNLYGFMQIIGVDRHIAEVSHPQ